MPDFSDDQIAAAWNIAESIEPKYLGKGLNPEDFRIVWPSGAVIGRDRFHMRGKYGWTIRNGQPVSFQTMTMAQVAAILASQRNRRYEAKSREAGYTRITVRIPENRLEELRAIVARWNSE